MKLLQQPVAALRNGKRGIFTSLITLTLVSSLTLSGCSSYDSFSRTTTGFSLGAMFGSAIGGILGGQRGYDIGTVVGGATGAVIGAASAESARKEREEYRREREAREYPYPAGRPSVDEAAESGISYGRFEPTRPTSVAPGNLEVSNIVFADATADRVLQPGEQAEITFDIYNRGNSPVRNVAPIVTADLRSCLCLATGHHQRDSSRSRLPLPCCRCGAQQCEAQTGRLHHCIPRRARSYCRSAPLHGQRGEGLKAT